MNFESQLPEKRLTENEALIYQAKATEKSGVGFSEKADDESYVEVEALLNKIKSAGIKLDGIDLDGIDLNNADSLNDLSVSLEKSILKSNESKNDQGIFEKISTLAGVVGLKKIVVLLGIFSTLSAEIATAGTIYGSNNGINNGVGSRNLLSGKDFNNGISGYSYIKYNGYDIKFAYDAKGHPVEFSLKSPNLNIDAKTEKQVGDIIKRMMVGNINEVLYKASLTGYNTINRNVIKRNLELVARTTLVNMGLHKLLKQQGKIEEANLVRTSSMNALVNQHDLVGAVVFDLSFARLVFEEKWESGQ